jgi:hypothetical protein
MRRIHRIVLLAALFGAAPILAGCENFDLDKLDVFDLNKKEKLPGERKPLFPNGVPGVSQGIPPEYLSGNLQEQPGAAIADPAAPQPADKAAATDDKKTTTVAPAGPAKLAPKPKQKAKTKPKTKVAAPAPAPAPQPAAQQQQQQQMAPWPDQAPPRQGTAAPWPTQQNDANAPWPSAPAPGTFSR